MATWEQLRTHILANYEVSHEGDTIVGIVFTLDDGRHQTVLVSRQGELDGVEWAEVGTPIAEEPQLQHVNPRDLLIENGNLIVGGLALREGLLIFRHSFPLADLDLSEFEGPLRMTVQIGDQLEKNLTGQDRY